MKKKILLLFVVATISLQNLSAQQFLTPFARFSDDKVSYITLADGTELQGYLRDLDRKKGLIEQVKFKDMDGKKYKFEPEDIAHMYLPPSGFSKYAASMDFLNDATQWDNKDLDADIISKGYAYFEFSDVMIKKKKKKMLMQLLNPSFCSVVRVYEDPFAKESASIGFAGVKVAGGHEKSYYVKSTGAAYKLKKKNYDEEFSLLFKSCDAVTEKFSKVKWTELADHVWEASKSCK